MIQSPALDLATARSYAQSVQHALADACDQFALAGALRRGLVSETPEGCILDFVVVPTVVNQPDETADGLTMPKDLLVDAIEGLDEAGECRLLQAFPHRECQLHNLLFPWGLVHLWLARPETFGSILIYRTGPDSHIQDLSALARQCQLCWMPYMGLVSGDQALGATEQEIYHQLGLAFIAPEKRKGELQCA